MPIDMKSSEEYFLDLACDNGYKVGLRDYGKVPFVNPYEEVYQPFAAAFAHGYWIAAREIDAQQAE
jgi:hypothetical protein